MNVKKELQPSHKRIVRTAAILFERAKIRRDYL
jgi:hypothetical protein